MPIFLFFSPSSPEQYIVTNCRSFTFHFHLRTPGFIKLLFSCLVSISLFFQVFSLLNYFLSIHSFLSQLSLPFTPFFFLFPCLSFSLFLFPLTIHSPILSLSFFISPLSFFHMHAPVQVSFTVISSHLIQPSPFHFFLCRCCFLFTTSIEAKTAPRIRN